MEYCLPSMKYLKIICLDKCYACFWVYIYLILFTSYFVSFLSTTFRRASKQTGLPLTWVKTKWPPPYVWWHKIKYIFSQREDAKVPVLMEVLVHTKWGAKMISVGSCVNFSRDKAEQVQCGCLSGSISHSTKDCWRRLPNTRLFAVGRLWGRACSSKAGLVLLLPVQGMDVLPQSCHHQVLLLCSSLASWGSSCFDMKHATQ